MYLEHFGLDQAPFTITPDTDFFFNYGSHNQALNVLLVAIRSGEGFIKVTGEVGTGKTLLCRKLLNTLDDGYVTAYIPNPFLSPDTLRMAFADELGIPFARSIDQHRLLRLITAKLVKINSEGKKVVLLLDEAQAMPDDSMEALRLLTNLETEKEKLVQVVLFGQPELDRRLQQTHLRQLKQRILFSYVLKPLDRDTLAIYLDHRMLIAGYRGKPLFSKQALRSLYRYSRGIPRLINVLSHKALMSAYGRGDHGISRKHIHRAALDTEDVQTRLPKVLAFAAGLFGLLTLTSAGLFAAWN